MPAAIASLLRVCSTMGTDSSVMASKNKYMVTMVPDSVSPIRVPSTRR